MADFLVMPLGGCEVVLGVQWLSTLGSIEWNFLQLTIKFELEGLKYELTNCNNTEVKVVSSRSLNKMLSQG